MNAALLCALPLLLLAASEPTEAPKAPRMDLLLGVSAQLRGGYTQSPFVTGPDAAPLASLGAASDAAPTAEFDTIVTPAITFNVNRSRLKFSVGYQPRIFYDALSAQPASVFHGVNLNLALGTDTTWLFTVGSNLSIGGLNLGQAGLALNQFSGSPASGGSAALDFFSLSAYARLERPITRRLKFTTTQTAGKIGTPPVGGSSYLSGAQSTAIPALQSQQRLDSDWRFAYKLNDRHAVDLDFVATLVAFPSTAAFPSYWPSLGWEGQFGRSNRWKVRGGVFKFWTNPFPGIYLKPDYYITGAISWEHNFAAANLPHLLLSIEVTEAPYYDIIYGTVSPRATFNVGLVNEFTRKFKGRVQLRDYTQAYFTGRRFLTIPKQRDKNVIVTSAEVNYQYVRWLGFVGGLYYLNRWIQPSATLTSTELRDIYAYVGVTGSYDVK